jgi:hypothetical protein
MRNPYIRIISSLIRPLLGFSFAACLIFAPASCKPTPAEPEPPVSKYYSITTVTVNIFDNSPAGGAVILNGERKDSGGTFEVENGNIDSLSVDVPAFNPNYILCQSEAGETILTKDGRGLSSFTANADITLHIKLIPSDFNTTLLARCIGGDQWDNNTNIYGDGTVQRYPGNVVGVGITEGPNGEKPTNESTQNLKNAVSLVNNAAHGQVILEYSNSEYDNQSGLWYIVDNRLSPLFIVRVSGDSTISISGFYMKKDAAYKAVLEGVVRTLGIRRNGGGDDYPYISENLTSPTFINDGERALRLIYLLPPGFRL